MMAAYIRLLFNILPRDIADVRNELLNCCVCSMSMVLNLQKLTLQGSG